MDADVPKPNVVHFLEPVELHLNDVFADESESEGPIEQKGDNPYKHVDTPIPCASERQKAVTTSVSDILSKLVSPTDTFNKAAATKQFSSALSKSSGVRMSKDDRNALPPKRTVMPMASVKPPQRAGKLFVYISIFNPIHTLLDCLFWYNLHSYDCDQVATSCHNGHFASPAGPASSLAPSCRCWQHSRQPRRVPTQDDTQVADRVRRAAAQAVAHAYPSGCAHPPRGSFQC